MIHNVADTIFVESFENLPAGGEVEFRPPVINGNLQIENEAVTKETPLLPVKFGVRTRLTYKQITLSRGDGEPFQIYHADPDFPKGFDDLSFMRNASPEELAAWEQEVWPHEGASPSYINPLRFALRSPVGELVLRQREPGEQWEVGGDAVVHNAVGLGRFLELAGKAAVRKLTPPTQAAA